MRKVTVKIGLKRIDMQERVIVEVLLDSGATRLVISSKFGKKQKFKLKMLERSIYVRNINSFFNKERPIKYMIKINIYYQRYRKRTEIGVISGQK